MAQLLFLFLALFVQHLVALDHVVDLGYAKYRGDTDGRGVVRWAGMRYARSPSRLDGMRFVAPQDPVQERRGNVVNATEFGPICIGTKYNLKDELGEVQSEDCLFANVWAPSNATNTSALPVYVFIQGGGFSVNGNFNYNATDLILAADRQLIVVNFNYRVGPYGFLASKEIAANKTLSLNNGLKDQRQLLKWVQNHISKFGGDPGHVTIGGASAGAGSVVLHLTAYGGRNDSLFHAASIESPAFTPQHNVTHSQYVYDRLLKEAKCADLTCLTNLDAVSFQAAARAMTANTPFRGEKNPPVYLWDPTLDYDFIQDYTLNEINAGHLVRVPTIVGDATNEGINFTPKKVTSWNGAIQFLSDQYTNIGKSEQHSIRQIWQGPTNAEFDGQWRLVASDVYGHMRYICGGLNISAAYATNGSSPTWQYRWNVGAAAHVAELLKIWHNGTTPAGVFVQGYFASFYRTYDPNKYTTTYLQDSGTVLTSPTWEEFGEAFGKRLLFEDEDDIRMETVSETQKEKCNFISSLQLEESISAASRSIGALPSSALLYLVYIIPLLALAQWSYP